MPAESMCKFILGILHTSALSWPGRWGPSVPSFSLWLAVTARKKIKQTPPSWDTPWGGGLSSPLELFIHQRKEVPWQIMKPGGKVHNFPAQRQLSRCAMSCQYALVWPGCPWTLSSHQKSLGFGVQQSKPLENNKLGGLQWSVMLNPVIKVHSTWYLRYFPSGLCKWGLWLCLFAITGVFSFVNLQQRLWYSRTLSVFVIIHPCC